MNLTLMGIISWCLFGLVIGWLAKAIMPGYQKLGWIATIGVGIAGSFAGGFINNVVFGPADNPITPSGVIMSIIGALIVLFIYGKMK